MRRSLVLAGLFLLLTGCGGADSRAPFAESRIPSSLSPRFWAPEGWAWGFIGVGEAPVQRYGVSSTMGSPRGNLLILTDDGETAEVWFETARDLNARGFTVWVLERSGQGGSARYAGPRDLIHAPTFDDDIAATKVLARTIVQSDPETPLTIVGQGVGGLVGLAAVQSGAPTATLILSDPKLKPTGRLPAWPPWLMKAGAGRLPSGLGQGWKREGSATGKTSPSRDRQRGAVQLAWQVANPDLRMGGHSLGWTSGFAATSKATLANLKGIEVRTYLLAAQSAPGSRLLYDACATMPNCSTAGIEPPRGEPAASLDGSYFLGVDVVRAWWLHELSCSVPDHPRIPALAGEGPCPMDRVRPTPSGHPL